MGGLPVARWTITLNHPPPPSSLPYSSISPRSGPTPLRWPEGRPAPLMGLLLCLQSACSAMALGLLQCDNLCLLRYALPWWIHLVTTWHSLLGIQCCFCSRGWGECCEGLFSDCQRDSFFFFFSSLPLRFISPPPTSAEWFNLSEDPGVSAVVVAGVGFFTSAGPVWEKALLGI